MTPFSQISDLSTAIIKNSRGAKTLELFGRRSRLRMLLPTQCLIELIRETVTPPKHVHFSIFTPSPPSLPPRSSQQRLRSVPTLDQRVYCHVNPCTCAIRLHCGSRSQSAPLFERNSTRPTPCASQPPKYHNLTIASP
jgi:hypothetical protein